MRYIIPISGKDSLATAILQKQLEPDLQYEYVFNPTGSELPEVFNWMKSVESYLGQKIIHVGENLEAIIEMYNYFLPNQKARYCTRESKIEPFVKWINGEECTVFYGIRADENRKGFNNSASPNIHSKMPLAEKGIDLKGVYLIINSKGLKPPTFFWESVYNEVCRILNFEVKTVLTEYEFDVLFAGRSRANCFICFNQRLYELVWMLEVYPDLFHKMEWYESQGGEKEYTWKKDYPMRKIKDNANTIKRKRIYIIIKYIAKKMQLNLLIEPVDEDDEEYYDVLSVKSCGLFCGK
jgi:hypothetical protein